MSLRHAILVLLEDQEASGYDLAREFAQGMGNVWNATHQQIYLELGRLTKEGLVEFRHVPQEGRPDKKIYRVTRAGYDELCAWMDEPAAHPRLRDALMIKIVGGHLADSEKLLAELREQMDMHREIQANFQAMEAAYQELSSEARERKLFAYLALRRGLLSEQSWMEWAREVESVLEERIARQQDTGGDIASA